VSVAGRESAAGSEVVAGLLGADLDRRLERACGEARELLGRDAHTDGRSRGAGDAAALRELITGLAGLLADAPTGGDQLVREHDAALERVRDRFDTRWHALDRARESVTELREITSPTTMLARAPAALCGASRFERAIVSNISGGLMTAEAAHVGDDEAGAERVLQELRANPIRLEHPLIETELLRRRRATIVVDARVHPRVDRRLGRLMDWSSYAAAPLVVEAKVIGVLHADRGRDGRLDVLDRDVLWEFASALAQAYEIATLLRTLRHEREQMRQFVDWLSAGSGELTSAPLRLGTVLRPPRPPISPEDQLVAPAGRDDRAVFDGLLTRRELDVLRLLADGNSNKAIAEALVISDGTVKFHVNSILRKLRVANRAEAVSRYLRLLGMSAP
jgi:DNA-binding CsgD family transcriptional regulator